MKFFNIMKRGLSLFLCIFLSAFCSAQYVLSGSIMDAYENQSVPNALLDNNELSIGHTTDEKGNFQIELSDKAPRVFEVSAPGYLSKSITLEAEKEFYEIRLEREKLEQNELVITASTLNRKDRTGSYGVNKKTTLQRRRLFKSDGRS